MEEIDKKQKDRYIKGISLNVFIILGILVYIFWFVLPKYTFIGELSAKINDTYSHIHSLRDNGVDGAEFKKLLATYNKKKDIPDSVFSDAAKLEQVLKKPTTFKGNYLAWILDANGKIETINAEVEKNDRILGNIIPNYTSVALSEDAAIIKNQITFSSFINYVEKEILNKYSLTSFSTLGLDNISFDSDKKSTVNIGSFKISLDFKGKNSDILALINALQNSGKLTIRNGKLIPQEGMQKKKSSTLSELSNLLVGINSFSLTNVLEDPSQGSLKDMNQGTLSLEFYVEGMNYQKLLLLRNSAVTDFEALKKSIKIDGARCDKPGNTLCNEGATNTAVSVIKNLSSNMASLQPKIDVLKKNELITDVNKEFDTLSDIKASIQAIKILYNKNVAILNKSKNTTNSK